jgi:glycosyltransferase involved in cell wall biosynthesis
MRLAPFATAAVQLGIPYIITLTDFWTICPKINLRTSRESLCTGPEGGQACTQLCTELGQELVTARLSRTRRILGQAKAVTCPSRLVARLIGKEFSDIQATVVPHGLALGKFYPKERQYSETSRLTFAYCGGLAAHKGVHVLIEAVRAVDSDRLELLIYGTAGPSEKDYERRLRAMAAPDPRIKFCGAYAQQDAGDVFRTIDVLVIPSLCYESYSFTLHQAVASSVPVIASAVGSLDEKLKDGINGFLFPMGDAAALTGKLQQVVGNPSILAALRRNLQTLLCPMLEEEAYLYERLYRAAGSQLASKAEV